MGIFIEVNTATDVAPDWKVIDTFDDYVMKFKSQYFSEKPSELKAPISEAFEIPLTDRNGMTFGISTTAPAKVPDLPARVIEDGTVLFIGEMRVDKFRWNGLNNLIGVQLEDKVAKAIRQMKKLNMSEFITDTENTTVTGTGTNGGYRHYMWEGTVLNTGSINYTNSASEKIKYGYQDTIGSGESRVMYPFKADYDFDEKDGTQGLQPVYNVKNIIQSAFDRVGLNIDGDFFNDLSTMDSPSEVYAASDLWMSLPAYWLAHKDDTTAGNAFTGHAPQWEAYGPTMGDRRTFSHSWNMTYASSANDMIFGRGSWMNIPSSIGIVRRWLYASHLTPVPKQIKSSVVQAHNVIDGYVSGVDNPRPVVVFNRPCRYKVDASSFPSMPAYKISVAKMVSQGYSSSPKLQLSDGVTSYSASFYWSMILRKPNGEEKEFRVSNELTATENSTFGWLEIPAATLSMSYSREAEKWIDMNTGDQIEAFLMLKASEDTTTVIYDANTNTDPYKKKSGGEMNDNVGLNYFFTHQPLTGQSVTGDLTIDFSPWEDSFPVTTGEVVNAKLSLSTAYPETSLWDLVRIITERFNLQLSYDLSNDVVYVDPVYRNKWLKSQENATQIDYIHKFDNSEPIEANVRKDSLGLITIKNKTYNSVGDKDSVTGDPIASVIKKEVDPDGDIDYSLSLKSGVFTGVVYGSKDDIVRKGDQAIPDNVLLAGQSPVNEVRASEYGIRFGFRSLNTSNLPATVKATLRWPLALEFEGQLEEHKGIASYIVIGAAGYSGDYTAAMWDLNHVRYYFDQGDIDYTVSCGVGDVRNSAYTLFHEGHILTAHTKTKLDLSFIIGLEDLSTVKFGSVIDFGMGDFGVMSVDDVSILEEDSKAKVTGYLL